MDTTYNNRDNHAMWWISSLAVSVVLCSVLFVVFASTINDMKATNKVAIDRLEMETRHQRDMIVSIEGLQRKLLADAHAGMAQPGSSAVSPTPTEMPVTMPSVTTPTINAPQIGQPVTPNLPAAQ